MLTRTGTLVVAAVMGGWLLCGGLQSTAAIEPPADLAQRVAELEKKVERIERQLSAKFTAPADRLADAEINLSAAEEQFQYSQRLHAKGFVTKMQLDADRLRVVVARKQVELAKGAKTDVGKLLEIDLLEAEHYLALAEQRLQFTRRLATKGYATENQVKTDTFTVHKARQDLDRAKARLKAHGTD